MEYSENLIKCINIVAKKYNEVPSVVEIDSNLFYIKDNLS